MSEVPDRTPVVTVELQLRPQPPKGASPWFWGGGMLDFHDGPRDYPEVVWRAELPRELSKGSVRVEYVRDFGWVLVARFTHDAAKRLLAGLDLGWEVWGKPIGEALV